MTAVQDATRRDAIADYRIVGEQPAADLEGLVHLAATICGVPTAVINIIDDRFQHQIAAIGFAASTCAREDSMCAAVLQQPGRVVVSDARIDIRFMDNPFVTGDIARVRFYASSPLITPAGVAIGTLCVFDEITGDLTPERAQALDLLARQIVELLELRRLASALEKSNQQLESFAGQVSHDLRNPLTALTGFIELAVDSPELANAPQASRVLARAESAAERMNTMITDLLDYARVGGSQPRRDELSLTDVVASVIDDLSAVIEATGAEVVVDAPDPVVGDPTLLRALLQNLVANAIKFTAASGTTPHVEVRAHALPGGWRITVDDNGPGVAPELRDRVFELMERGTAHEVDGLGIGLSTCRRIVEGHRGRIGIDDSPLGGARVWVTLPAQPRGT